jgi:hypothetical protein
VGTLAEGPNRGELGAVYICYDCVELCASIFETQKQRTVAPQSETDESAINAATQEGGVLIRPAVIFPVEVYTPERKAQFLLSNAVDAIDYADAVASVRAVGLDPNAIPHYKPPGA